MPKSKIPTRRATWLERNIIAPDPHPVQSRLDILDQPTGRTIVEDTQQVVAATPGFHQDGNHGWAPFPKRPSLLSVLRKRVGR